MIETPGAKIRKNFWKSNCPSWGVGGGRWHVLHTMKQHDASGFADVEMQRLKLYTVYILKWRTCNLRRYESVHGRAEFAGTFPSFPFPPPPGTFPLGGQRAKLTPPTPRSPPPQNNLTTGKSENLGSYPLPTCTLPAFHFSLQRAQAVLWSIWLCVKESFQCLLRVCECVCLDAWLLYPGKIEFLFISTFCMY